MNRLLLVFTALFLLAPDPAGADASRPNVIVVMTDDQGHGDLGFTGNPVIRTPNIDAMARRSVRLTRFHVNPVCAPTRACLMTGRYNYRTRCIDTFAGRAMMEPAEVTMAEILGAAGYATGIFGKWHLGDNYPLRPLDQGFQRALVHRGGGIGQPSDPPGGEGKYTDPILFDNGKARRAPGYCTDIYFDAALEWIEKSHRGGRNFFAYIPTNAPHGPFHDVPEEIYRQYASADVRPAMLSGRDSKKQVDRLARIFAMITNIDDNVGKLFGKLEEIGIVKNTLVIFLVDNGPNSDRYVGTMRGRKTQVYEGGIRSPFFVHWPGRLEAGRESDRVAAHIDILPTILDACGVALPAGLQIDGRSLLPLLEGKDVEWPDRTLFVQSHRGNVPVRYHNFAAVAQRWKLVHPSGFHHEKLTGPPRFELYDLVEDPGERSNLAAERPEIVARLRKQYDVWFDDVGSTRPDNYAPPRIHVGTPHENPVVLTRQDWRRLDDRPWDADSNGFWMLHVARKGSHDVLLRFPAVDAPTTITLTVGPATIEGKLEKGAREHTFDNITLPAGDADLQATLLTDDRRRGPWQVEVKRQ